MRESLGQDVASAPTRQAVDVAALEGGLDGTPEGEWCGRERQPDRRERVEETPGFFAGVRIGNVDAIKSHNPFALNDLAFAREMGVDVMTMNNFGCSLIWGHPQGPTGLRGIIELIEELALRGGGVGLFHGCAAGDTAMAVILKVEQA